GYPAQAVEQYSDLKLPWFHPEPGKPRPERKLLEEKRAEIDHAFESILSNSPLREASMSATGRPFDWEADFAEAFNPAKGRHGFDIVIANPPYVNSGELARAVGERYKAELVKAYPNTGSGTADLLVYFMDRAVQLLRPGGQLAFITSNKWLKASYGA